MASININSTPSADTPIAIKLAVNNGENRRFKLVLRDLGANTLPDKLRSLLNVPPTQNITFERYSDSAGSYIALDSNNPAVYKQLYRAAKAKLKLRIKATITDPSSSELDCTSTSDHLPPHCYTPPKNARKPSQEPGPTDAQLMCDLAALNGTNGVKLSVSDHTPHQTSQRSKLPYDPCLSPSVAVETTDCSLLDTANPIMNDAIHDFQTQLLLLEQHNKKRLLMARQSPAAEDYQMQLMLLEQQNKKRLLMARQEQELAAEAPVPRSFTAREEVTAGLADKSVDCTTKPLADAKLSTVAGSFTICCNRCQANIPDAHWHCSRCNAGDFDLCGTCIEKGVLCDSEDHWLIKRSIDNGRVVNSITEKIAPKTKEVEPKTETSAASAIHGSQVMNGLERAVVGTMGHKKHINPLREKGVYAPHIREIALARNSKNTLVLPDDALPQRTCNSCVEDLPESKFVTCKSCDDFDLCIPCFTGAQHGHHPGHAFAPACSSTKLDSKAIRLCSPGRNLRHFAICDGCDKDIYGTRHKCLNCPDWDFCSACIKTARTSHPGHRFIPLNEPIPFTSNRGPVHYNINCDGPLCKDIKTFIAGDRYKCAICHDIDFCAKCEALPTNRHNRTHPLIKFKSPVRNVSVTTLGEKENGEHMCTMGDQLPQFTSKATETVPMAPSANAATQVQTVAEIKPIDAVKEPKEVVPKEVLSQELQAHFIRDAVPDGSLLAPSRQFEQVWTLRNPGPHAWPAGCSVRFVGGDTMFNVDPNHPSSVANITKATESNVVDRVVQVGEEVDFTVVMRTPEREGKAISHWRLKSADGMPFGHKLWCDIVVQGGGKDEENKAAAEANVELQKVNSSTKESPDASADKEEEGAASTHSQMIFPTLDKESPVSSTHEAAAAASSASSAASVAASAVTANEEKELLEEVENLSLADEVSTDDGFMTDEEFEMLDASEDDFAEAVNGKLK